MPTRKNTDTAPHGRLVAILAGACLLALLIAWWCWPAKPALGSDREVVATTDALFTALTSQNEDRLAECERRFHALRETGHLPTDAAEYLAKIVGQARAGRWDAAARKLYAFIRSQSPRATVSAGTTAAHG